MKKTIIALIILFTGLPALLDAQVLINQGSDIIVTAGSFVYIDGDFENQLDGTINLAGEVSLTGDWSNNATSGNLLIGTSGTVNLIGSSTQYIGGSNFTYFYNLNLQNDANLDNTQSISGILNLNSNYFTLDNYSIVMQFGSNIIGASTSGYIVTNGTGYLLQYNNGTGIDYPIGSSSQFAPVTLANSGTADYFSARVFADVLTGGTSGSTIPEINDCVNMTWDVNENSAGGSNLAITTYWGAAMEGTSFNRNSCGMGHYTGGVWDPQVAGAASGPGPYFLTRGGITTLSPFAIGDLQSPMAIQLDMSMDLTAFLEGPFNGSDMNIDLRDGGYIPLAQPYSVAPWNYPGGEVVPSIPPNVVDWVLVQLRDAPTAGGAIPSTAVATRAAFILDDGSIVDLDGSTNLSFNVVINDNLYAVVWHRNHLGIISANALTDAGGGLYPYNFTTGSGQALGPNGQKSIASGVYGMFGGDGTSSGVVSTWDKTTIWEPFVGTEGYNEADFNLSGQTSNEDKNDTYLGNIGASTKVPQ